MSTAIPENRASFTTESAASASGGLVVRSHGTRSHVGVTTDSRAVRAGGIFVALRGERFDGHAFVQGAAKDGATLLVVEKGHPIGSSGDSDVIEVGDTLAAWGNLARARVVAWKERGGKVVAITGSAGKTTTKELCAALLASVGAVHATRGNLNNRIGVPAVALALEDRHAFAVIEMGMSERGEIARLAEIAPPDVSVITNVGLAHAGGVGGGVETVANEKGAIFAALGEGEIAVANIDDPFVMSQSKRARGRVVTFGRAREASYRLAARESLGARGSRVTVERAGSSITVDLPLVGEAAAVDFVAALAAAESLSGRALDQTKIDDALATCALPSGRVSIRRLADGTLVIDDTYNANPDSVRAALSSLVEIAASEKRRTVVVLGEMRELGTHAEEAHAAIGDAIGGAGVALLISCGGLADVALEGAARAGVTIKSALDAESASKIALSEVLPGDAVLVKASRGVAAEVVVEALVQARGEART